eukprot:8042982-Ditylum_brightwellii.AAC.1
MAQEEAPSPTTSTSIFHNIHAAGIIAPTFCYNSNASAYTNNNGKLTSTEFVTSSNTTPYMMPPTQSLHP